MTTTYDRPAGDDQHKYQEIRDRFLPSAVQPRCACGWVGSGWRAEALAFAEYEDHRQASEAQA
jgi:hypothetical protein